LGLNAAKQGEVSVSSVGARKTGHSYVRQLQQLIDDLLANGKLQQSVYQSACQFFSEDQHQKQQLRAQEQLWQQCQAELPQATAKTEAALIAKVQQQRASFQQAHQQYQQQLQLRYEQLLQLCQKLLRLSEGSTPEETIYRSSRLLGSLQLMAPSNGDFIASVQQKYKPFYKAVLSLRLLDDALKYQLIKDPYLEEQAQQRNSELDPEQCPFRLNVQIPLLMALLMQDIGFCLPEIREGFQGPSGEPLQQRELTPTERQQYLQLSLDAALQYLQHGIAQSPYRGHSKTEKADYEAIYQQRIQFSTRLLQSAAVPGGGLGNLLKIPQVYASAVLPGRNRFNYQALPKVALILKNGAKQGQYDDQLVNVLLTMTGIFPQGYGIVFLPKDASGLSLERYEFAIVNSLYPAKPEVPICRVVSRKLQFRSVGPNCTVSVAQNLYFKPARQQLAVIPAARLKEILQKLSASADSDPLRYQLPRYWHPDQFFADPKHQNLWNKTELLEN
jgi:hypothetical protein